MPFLWSRHWHGSIATTVRVPVAACGWCGSWHSMQPWRPFSCCVVRSSRFSVRLRRFLGVLCRSEPRHELSRECARPFMFGYFGSSQSGRRGLRDRRLVRRRLLSVGFIDKRRRLGSLSFAVTLVLALGATTFVAIGPGAAVAGRLLYMPGMIVSIMIGAGLSSLLDILRRTSRGHLRLAATLAALPAAALIAVEFASLQSFAWRFGESTSLARNVMAQIAPLRTSLSSRSQLPHLLANGPYVLKCYTLAMHLDPPRAGRRGFAAIECFSTTAKKGRGDDAA